MSKNGVKEMDDTLQKKFEEFLPLFMQVVEEVKNEKSEEA